MKRTSLVIALFLAGAVYSASLFAGGTTELSITNKTGALVEEIQIRETETGSIRSYYYTLENNAATVIIIKRDMYYDITLVDANRHIYGVTGRKWDRGHNTLEISHSDFIYQGLVDLFKRLIGR